MNINTSLKFNKGCDYPLSFPLTSIPSTPSGLHSPKVGKSHGIPDLFTGNEHELIDEVIDVVGKVNRNEFPHEFLAKHYPAQWGEYTKAMPAPLRPEGLSINNPQACANVVHMDNPIDMPNAVLSWVLSQGAKPKNVDTNHVNFLNAVPDAVAKMAEAIRVALHKGFEVKYFYGVARPEEHIGENFTAYAEGCPPHPSYPAGHACAAGAGCQAIIDHFDLTDEQIKTVRDSAYFWSQFRTFAGVHYSVDNIAGLMVSGIL
jgi:hypothetical protein